jgi:formylmethanofuran dehydrogenase subunit E
MGTKANRRARGVRLSEDRRTVEHVGVEIEESAGAKISGEFRCADCGYGAVVQRVLPLCPMCGGATWESRGQVGPRLED